MKLEDENLSCSGDPRMLEIQDYGASPEESCRHIAEMTLERLSDPGQAGGRAGGVGLIGAVGVQVGATTSLRCWTWGMGLVLTTPLSFGLSLI